MSIRKLPVADTETFCPWRPRPDGRRTTGARIRAVLIGAAEGARCYDSAQARCLTFGGAALIDNPDKVKSLIALLESNLPLRARITPRLAETLREKSPGMVVPQECDVAAIHYAGDEGGILCALDFGDDAMKQVHIVSITHLAFHRANSYARNIEVYQRHRIKKIRQLQYHSPR